MNIGLCSGRHDMNTNDGEKMDYYLFDNPVDSPTATDEHEKVCRDFIKLLIKNRVYEEKNKPFIVYEDINLYITGLTPLLTSFLKCWVDYQEHLEMTCGNLVLWHWDTEVKQYIPQKWAVIT